MRYYASLLLVAFFAILVLWAIDRGKKGIKPNLRIADGIHGVDEGIGRATEMGRPVFFHAGISAGGTPETTAALSVLSYVVKKCIQQGASLFIGVCMASKLPYVQEVVRTSSIAAGHPEAEKNIRVEYLSDAQFGFASSYNGRMVRENAAANLFFGGMGADTLLYAETGARIGAFQVVGSVDTGNIHWGAIVCDYLILPEELYEAGAILSGDLVEQNIMVSYDILRVVAIVAFLVVGLVVTHVFGFPTWSKFVTQ